MLFDVHSHINFLAYDQDREAVIARAKEAGVKMVAVGTQISNSEMAISLAEKYPNDVWAVVGFHPHHASSAKWHLDKKEQKRAEPEIFDLERLRQLSKSDKVIAIGECGLDYHRLEILKDEAEKIKNRQREVFLKQISLAEELGKALMIHCRPSFGSDDAYMDVLEILQKERVQAPVVMHFYAGSLSVTKKLVEAGFYFTFGGVLTFTGDYDEIAKHIPLDRILLETDCPYVSPQSHRGERNEPAFIWETAKRMAELKNESLDSLAEKICGNTVAVFKIRI